MSNVLKIIGSILFSSYFWYCALTPSKWHFIDAVNLIFHEAGHAISIFFPSLIAALMGSGFQVLVPLIFVMYFYKRRELLSVYLLLLWLGQNIMNVSLYIRDAIPMNLNLLGGDAVTHDWNYILGELGLLSQSILIANMVAITSYTLMLVSTILIINTFVNKQSTI